MKPFICLVVALFFSPYITAERVESNKAPVGWHGSSNPQDAFDIGIDHHACHNGKSCGSIKSREPAREGFATWVQSYDAGKYRNKKIRLSAFLKTENVKDWSAMWMRIDGKKGPLTMDNMRDRPLVGTKDWAAYDIVLDVPPDAINISFGILLNGSGKIWIDDVSFEEVPKSAEPELFIRGKVKSQERAISEATVALVRTGFVGRADQIVTSNKEGAFEFNNIQSGEYWIAATANGYEVNRLGPYVVKEKGLSDIQLNLMKGGIEVSGRVQTPEGKAIGDAYVSSFMVNPDEWCCYYTRTDLKGNYTFHFSAGSSYELQPFSDAYEENTQLVEVKEPQNVNLTASLIEKPPAPQEVLQWIQKNSIPLRTVEAGHGFDDMQSLKKIVGDADLVCLGEATHGSREFFQLKHRMLEFLVSEMGFTVFGIEATYPEAYAINKYVLTGEGDPAEALRDLYFWTWNTEEVLEMIRWMREYNSSHEKKVKFYGFDIQSPKNAAKFALDYLQKAEGKDPEELRKRLAFFESQGSGFSKLTDEEKEQAKKAVQELMDTFDQNKQAYVSRNGLKEWEIARQHGRVAQLFVDMRLHRNSMTYSVRDAAMAETIQWILKHEGPGTKMVAWAHNGHVAFDGDPKYGKAMGWHLRQAFGKDVVVFGFSFNQGAFQAIDRPGGKGLQTFTVGPAPKGSLDETLARAGLKIAAIDFGQIGKDAHAEKWFAQKRITRSIGAVFNPGSEKFYFYNTEVRKSYDALFFIETTTSAIPVEQPRPEMIFSPEPVNLDFESGG